MHSCRSRGASWYLAPLLALLLTGCTASEDLRHEGAKGPVFSTEQPEGTAEELYFEALRLNSAGLLSAHRLDELHRRLAIVDEAYSGDDDHERLLRAALRSQLRLAGDEARREDSLAFEAWEGRAYARKLNRAGVSAADQYAEGMVFLAGMVGVPTSAEEGLLMVALPAGGYLIVKASGMAFQRAVFLLRRCKKTDDVVASAKRLGFEVKQVPNANALRTEVTRKDLELSRSFEEVLERIPRETPKNTRESSASHVTSMRNVEVRSQSSRAADIKSVARGMEAYASTNVLQSRLREFIAQNMKPEFDEPIEFFVHGTTQARAESFQLEKGLRLFTATDIHVALFFSRRTVGREGGQVGVAVIALPRTVAAQLRQNRLLTTRPVPDMPGLMETVFEPGAFETLQDRAYIQSLPGGFFDP